MMPDDVPTCAICGNEIECHEDCDLCSDPCVEISIQIDEVGIQKYLYAHNSGKCPEKLKQLLLNQGSEELRRSGIDVVGDIPWGTHLCQFYQTKEDLIDILVPYFKAGLENNEFCLWVTSEPLKVEDAKTVLKRAVNLDGYIKKGQIEILDYSQWYTKSGEFDADEVLQGWAKKEEQAIRNGFDGLRATGNTFWLEKRDWRKFADYEAMVNSVIGEYRMIVICSYSLDKCGASEVIDAVSNHPFVLDSQRGKWGLIENTASFNLGRGAVFSGVKS